MERQRHSNRRSGRRDTAAVSGEAMDSLQIGDGKMSFHYFHYKTIFQGVYVNLLEGSHVQYVGTGWDAKRRQDGNSEAGGGNASGAERQGARLMMGLFKNVGFIDDSYGFIVFIAPIYGNS